MSMSKKDFELIADVFRRELADVQGAEIGPTGAIARQSARATLHKCALTLAHAIRQTNPAFDHEGFMRACCGWEKNGQE